MAISRWKMELEKRNLTAWLCAIQKIRRSGFASQIKQQMINESSLSIIINNKIFLFPHLNSFTAWDCIITFFFWKREKKMIILHESSSR